MVELATGFIVTRNFKFIYDALDSLKDTTTPSQVYVVLNGGAEDEHLQRLRSDYPDVQLIMHDELKSFAANHNLIVQHSTAPYIALLNDDITIKSNALDVLVEYLKAHPEIAMVGPQLENTDGSLQVSQYSHLSLLRAIYKISGLARLTYQGSVARRLLTRTGIIKLASFQVYTEPTVVDVVKGAAMVVRRDAVEAVGGLDEIYQLYVEEFDWQWRFQQQGWQVAIVPDARIVHHGLGQVELKLNAWKLREDRRSLLTYFIKHRPWWQVLTIRVAIVLSHSFWGLTWVLRLNRERAKNHFEVVNIGMTWSPPR